MRSRHPRRLTLRTYRRAWRGTTEPLERRTLMSVFYVDDTAAGPVHVLSPDVVRETR